MPTNFDELKGAISESEAYDQIRSDETAFSDETFGDAEALGIVLQDASTAIAYFNSKGLLPAGIDNADDLIRAYVKPRVWPDGKPRSNLPMYVVLEAVEKLIPILHMSLFGSGKKRPFGLEPRGQTKPAAARAQASLLHWAMKQAGTKEEMRRMIKTCLTYGFTVGSWGWEDCEHKEKVYERQPDGTVKGTLKVVTIAQPTFECHDLKNILVDPACKRQDIQKGARYVIKQKMVTSNELDDLRDDDTYKNIPSRSDLRDILANKAEPTQDTLGAIKHATWREFQSELDSKSTSVDPLQQPLELLEYWTNDRVITVLQRRIVIRNEENEFGKLPFVSAAFVDVLGSAWGFGVARLLSGEQRLQQGVVNNWIDSLALVLNQIGRAHV